MAMIPMEYDGGGYKTVGYKTSSAVTINGNRGASITLAQEGNDDLTGYKAIGVLKAIVSGDEHLCIRGYDVSGSTAYIYAVNYQSSSVTIPSDSNCLKVLYKKD